MADSSTIAYRTPHHTTPHDSMDDDMEEFRKDFQAFYAMAKFDYEGQDKGEMGFMGGEILKIVGENQFGWWLSQSKQGKLGWVPSNYFDKIDKSQLKKLKRKGRQTDADKSQRESKSSVAKPESDTEEPLPPPPPPSKDPDEESEEMKQQPRKQTKTRRKDKSRSHRHVDNAELKAKLKKKAEAEAEAEAESESEEAPPQNNRKPRVKARRELKKRSGRKSKRKEDSSSSSSSSSSEERRQVPIITVQVDDEPVRESIGSPLPPPKEPFPQDEQERSRFQSRQRKASPHMPSDPEEDDEPEDEEPTPPHPSVLLRRKKKNQVRGDDSGESSSDDDLRHLTAKLKSKSAKSPRIPDFGGKGESQKPTSSSMKSRSEIEESKRSHRFNHVRSPESPRNARTYGPNKRELAENARRDPRKPKGSRSRDKNIHSARMEDEDEPVSPRTRSPSRARSGRKPISRAVTRENSRADAPNSRRLADRDRDRGESVPVINLVDDPVQKRKRRPRPKPCIACGDVVRPDDEQHDIPNVGRFHSDCLVCDECKTPLTPETVMQHEGQILCSNHYKKLFADRCAKCDQVLFGGFLNAMGKKWHRECFVCAKCESPFKDGKFRRYENKPFCSSCYAKQFASECSYCGDAIISGRSIRVGNLQFHGECFKCPYSGHDMGPSTPMRLVEGKAVCAEHAEEYAQRLNLSCDTCREKIAPDAELIKANGQHFHKSCFRCASCDVLISDPAMFEVIDGYIYGIGCCE